MTKRHRLERKGKGRTRKLFPRTQDNRNMLGGIPMTIKNGHISYAKKVPKGYSYNEKIKANSDSEEDMRRHAELPTGEGNFIRRHIYEMRFGIYEDETEDERRKREYLEWWEEQ